jgi:hypothetical protein
MPVSAITDPPSRSRGTAFRIWRESVDGGVRYIARSPHLGLNPHTVVTTDPAELRAALALSRSSGLAAGQHQP